ncbi:hypothetical protein ACJIZ3_004178 [Penstemon smallii]|uniref:SUN domain-containing protein n=1 Tax=Penstemon smallii TaxID=265156 RepID=A0ABD3S1A4_9LAMI
MKKIPNKVNPKNNVKNLNISSNISKKITRRRTSFRQLSVPLFFSFWAVIILFHTKFGLTRGNEGNHTTPVVQNVDKNQTSEVVVKLNVSVIVKDYTPYDIYPKSENSLQGKSSLEELVSIVLDYKAFICQIHQQEDVKEVEPEQHQSGRIQLTYPNLDEFKYISRQEKIGIYPQQLLNITHRLEPDGTPYNYASASKGAKVVAHNKEAKGASNVLGKDHDKYLRNPCSVEGKFFIIELADETLVDAVKIANHEHHSSTFKAFELYGSLTYPTETWVSLGSFVAANVKHAQCFKLPEPNWVRYLKVNLLSHYGSEFYCTLSVVEVYGVDAIEQMLEDLIVTSGEASNNRLPNPNSTAFPLILPEPSANNSEVDNVANNDTVTKGVGNVDEGKKVPLDVPKKPVVISSVPNSRLHADAALKVVLQKVRSLELNLSVLEEYIKELNKRQGEVFPELDKELLKFSILLEKTKSEMKNLMEWKEIMENGIFDLEAWKAAVSTRMDLLVTENSLLRLEIEKVLHDQASLERKELGILTLAFCFACTAILKLISRRVLTIFRTPISGTEYRSSRLWVLILVFCGMTMLIPLICS